MIPTARAAVLRLGSVLLLGAGLCLGGCARPGQRGQSPPAPAPVVPAAAPAAPTPVGLPTPEPVRGTLDSRVTIRTSGPAVYSVHTVVLDAGESLGWQRHAGSAVAVVRGGEVSLVREGACRAVRHSAGDALFVPDAEPHRLTNDGDGPAELLVTLLVAPDVAETTDVRPACSSD